MLNGKASMLFTGIFISMPLVNSAQFAKSKIMFASNWSRHCYIFLLCVDCVCFEEMMCANITLPGENARKIGNCALTKKHDTVLLCVRRYFIEWYHVARILCSDKKRNKRRAPLFHRRKNKYTCLLNNKQSLKHVNKTANKITLSLSKNINTFL